MTPTPPRRKSGNFTRLWSGKEWVLTSLKKALKLNFSLQWCEGQTAGGPGFRGRKYRAGSGAMFCICHTGRILPH